MFNHVEYIELLLLLLLLLLHAFNGLFSRTTCLSWFQKGKTHLDLTEARRQGFGMQWHQLDHIQTICTLLQTDNHTNTSSFKFTGRVLYLTPKQQCQSTEGIVANTELIPKCSNAKLNLTSCICTSIKNYKKISTSLLLINDLNSTITTLLFSHMTTYPVPWRGIWAPLETWYTGST